MPPKWAALGVPRCVQLWVWMFVLLQDVHNFLSVCLRCFFNQMVLSVYLTAGFLHGLPMPAAVSKEATPFYSF